MLLTRETLGDLKRLKRKSFDIKHPAETHVFMALATSTDHEIKDILESVPASFLDVSTLDREDKDTLNNIQSCFTLTRVKTLPYVPACFRTHALFTGAIPVKPLQVYFPKDVALLEKEITIRPHSIRKADIQAEIADSFRQYCAKHDLGEQVARIENSILHGIFYRALFARLPHADGYMAARYTCTPEIFLSVSEMNDLVRKISDIKRSLLIPSKKTEKAIAKVFEAKFVPFEVALYNTALEIIS